MVVSIVVSIGLGYTLTEKIEDHYTPAKMPPGYTLYCTDGQTEFTWKGPTEYEKETGLRSANRRAVIRDSWKIHKLRNRKSTPDVSAEPVFKQCD